MWKNKPKRRIKPCKTNLFHRHGCSLFQARTTACKAVLFLFFHTGKQALKGFSTHFSTGVENYVEKVKQAKLNLSNEIQAVLKTSPFGKSFCPAFFKKLAVKVFAPLFSKSGGLFSKKPEIK